MLIFLWIIFQQFYILFYSERLPGDGETSDDLGDEEELDNLEDNSSEGILKLFTLNKK